MSTQPDLGPDQHEDRTEQSMEVPEKIHSRSKLRPALVKKLGHIGETPKKKAMMQRIEETLLEAFELGFQAANSELKSAFFCFWRWFYRYDPQMNSGHHAD